ncbi:hypothetical protein [Synechococcus sp. WH 8020]|uniref:hypothetical protein n=1 Tax=Synechococcus sp. (strain WH8020) TaxID=32052 RepID=UPI000B020AE5|nr:hypothetical protein [Synechococcus sp. WH 8020]
MDLVERDNWKRILETLEAAGDRNSGFYRRAQAICNGEPDPLLEQERKDQEQREQNG